MKKDLKLSGRSYETPATVLLSLVVEQCIASSTGMSLGDMEKNLIYDENF